MSDPLALVPFALAANTGSINGYAVSQLVAAGVTLLQRSAPLVRALTGRRAALLLPTGPAQLVALAASDGRAAIMIDPQLSSAALAQILSDANVGAVFTLRAFTTRIPSGVTVVELDDAPRGATVIAPTRTHVVDLGSHHGLELTGARNAEGADEPWITAYDARHVEYQCTHRDVLQAARCISGHALYTPVDHIVILSPLRTLEVFVAFLVAPLFMGGRITVIEVTDASTPWPQHVPSIGATRLVASFATLERLVHDRVFDAPNRAAHRATNGAVNGAADSAATGNARIAYCLDATPSAAFRTTFHERTGIELPMFPYATICNLAVR